MFSGLWITASRYPARYSNWKVGRLPHPSFSRLITSKLSPAPRISTPKHLLSPHFSGPTCPCCDLTVLRTPYYLLNLPASVLAIVGYFSQKRNENTWKPLIRSHDFPFKSRLVILQIKAKILILTHKTSSDITLDYLFIHSSSVFPQTPPYSSPSGLLSFPPVN